MGCGGERGHARDESPLPVRVADVEYAARRARRDTGRAAQWDRAEWIITEHNEGRRVDNVDSKDESPLHTAARCGSIHAAKALITLGVDGGAPSRAHACTPIWFAARDGHEGVLRVLMGTKKAKANVDHPGGLRKETPLHRAAFYGNSGCAMILLEAGASLGPGEPGGQTPLGAAREKGFKAVEELLVDWARGGRPAGPPRGARAEIGRLDAVHQELLSRRGHRRRSSQKVTTPTPKLL